MMSEHSFDRPAIYQIHIQGVLDQSWSDWFGGFTITYPDHETLLEGTVTDQAALHGILAKINNLGLTLISVNKLSDCDPEK